MKLSELQSEQLEWANRNFKNRTTYGALLGAMEELGELAHAHLKGEQGIRHSAEDIHLMKRDAVGDVIIFLADYCSRNNIDLDAAVELTWLEVKKRDWKANPMDANKVAEGR